MQLELERCARDSYDPLEAIQRFFTYKTSKVGAKRFRLVALGVFS
jgi:hypothetical protein